MEKKEMLMLENKVERTMAKIDLIIDKIVIYSVTSFMFLIIGMLLLSKAITEQNVLLYIVAGLCLLTALYGFGVKMKQLDYSLTERANNLKEYISFLGNSNEDGYTKSYEEGEMDRLTRFIPHNKKQGGK